MRDRVEFRAMLRELSNRSGIRLSAGERKAIESALSERDSDAAQSVAAARGKIEPDSELRDTETVPLGEDIDDYMAREVLPHVPDAWVDESKTKVGYEIPLNRHFYVYEPPRALDEIRCDLQQLEREIAGLISDVVRS